MTDDPMMEKLYAAVFIAKYGGIVVVNDLSADGIFPLLLERLNIFTDPQKPMIISPGIYEIGTPGPDSPVAITTNFALTYFIVSGEIEASKVPTWLLIQDTEGLSVMTAWAAGKFSGDSVAMFVKKAGLPTRSRPVPSSFRDMPRVSAATWKRNCPIGKFSSGRGKPPISRPC